MFLAGARGRSGSQQQERRWRPGGHGGRKLNMPRTSYASATRQPRCSESTARGMAIEHRVRVPTRICVLFFADKIEDGCEAEQEGGCEAEGMGHWTRTLGMYAVPTLVRSQHRRGRGLTPRGPHRGPISFVMVAPARCVGRAAHGRRRLGAARRAVAGARRSAVAHGPCAWRWPWACA